MKPAWTPFLTPLSTSAVSSRVPTTEGQQHPNPLSWTSTSSISESNIRAKVFKAFLYLYMQMFIGCPLWTKHNSECERYKVSTFMESTCWWFRAMGSSGEHLADIGFPFRLEKRGVLNPHQLSPLPWGQCALTRTCLCPSIFS